MKYFASLAIAATLLSLPLTAAAQDGSRWEYNNGLAVVGDSNPNDERVSRLNVVCFGGKTIRIVLETEISNPIKFNGVDAEGVRVLPDFVRRDIRGDLQKIGIKGIKAEGIADPLMPAVEFSPNQFTFLMNDEVKATMLKLMKQDAGILFNIIDGSFDRDRMDETIKKTGFVLTGAREAIQRVEADCG